MYFNSSIGELSFQCSECSFRVDGPYDDAVQVIRFHRIQHNYAYQHGFVDNLLKEIEAQ